MNHQAQIDSVIGPALEALRLVDGAALPGYFIMAPGRHVPPPPGFAPAVAAATVNLNMQLPATAPPGAIPVPVFNAAMPPPIPAPEPIAAQLWQWPPPAPAGAHAAAAAAAAAAAPAPGAIPVPVFNAAMPPPIPAPEPIAAQLWQWPPPRRPAAIIGPNMNDQPDEEWTDHTFVEGRGGNLILQTGGYKFSKNGVKNRAGNRRVQTFICANYRKTHCTAKVRPSTLHILHYK